jgi:hypothetical protein
MKPSASTSLALLAAVLAAPAFAATEGIVLFTQTGAQILGTNGVARPAKRGDVLLTGERLQTPPGGISQVRLIDGSLIGMKPGSELKFDLPPQAGDKAKHVVSLLHGALHVIGSDLMDASKPSELTLQSGLATVNVKGSDLESAVVAPPPPASPAPAGTTVQPLPAPVADVGSYSKLIVGAATISTGILPAAPLPVNQISFVGTTLNVAPIVVASVAPSVFNPIVTTAVLPASGTTTTGTVASLVGGNIAAAAITPASTNTATNPTVTNALMPSLTTSTLSASSTLGIAPGTGKTLGTVSVGALPATPVFSSVGTLAVAGASAAASGNSAANLATSGPKVVQPVQVATTPAPVIPILVPIVVPPMPTVTTIITRCIRGVTC